MSQSLWGYFAILNLANHSRRKFHLPLRSESRQFAHNIAVFDFLSKSGGRCKLWLLLLSLSSVLRDRTSLRCGLNFIALHAMDEGVCCVPNCKFCDLTSSILRFDVRVGGIEAYDFASDYLSSVRNSNSLKIGHWRNLWRSAQQSHWMHFVASWERNWHWVGSAWL